MSFFNGLLKKNNLSQHDGRALWKYKLNDSDIISLISKLQFGKIDSIDPRDATLFYSIWWKKKYAGNSPSKKSIFESIGGNSRFYYTCDEFYDLAKKGARILSIKWIKKQNTLYFRTLLLQGGLPLDHISKNQSQYQNFLLAVLEEQPNTIEDFIFKSEITSLLPKSSQNEVIYENCLEIVKSILEDKEDFEELLNSDEVIKSISTQLKKRKTDLQKKTRISKPRNYWTMKLDGNNTEISLKVGLADTYTSISLADILGLEIKEREYQFYINDDLICIFRKMANGNFKTDWYCQHNIQWLQNNNFPYTYVIVNNQKIEINDFIQITPNFDEPSLWDKYSENEWRLIKGNGTTSKQAAVLFPNNWKSNIVAQQLQIYDKDLSWLQFEGETEVFKGNEVIKYLSSVNSFNWTIVSQKPSNILKANMPIVNKIPCVLVYDQNNILITPPKHKAWFKKHNSNENWIELTKENNIPNGCINLKIEKEGLIAYDKFFNIGSLDIKYLNRSLDKAEIELNNFDDFDFIINESEILNIEKKDNNYLLKIDIQDGKIPTSIKGSIGYSNQQKLHFELDSPFRGMAITDKNGNIVHEKTKLSLSNLYGFRILNSFNTESIITIRNGLKDDVKISVELKKSPFPIIALKEEINRLYYLADIMNYKNKVHIDLADDKNKKSYELLGFSHTLNTNNQIDRNLSLYNSKDDLDLYAVPLNCSSKDIELIPLFKKEYVYTIPLTSITNQFIIISSKESDSQLMPRFVNTDKSFISTNKYDRIQKIHNQLIENNFKDDIWEQVLKYFQICINNNIPFSTFDELRAISKSSLIASKAFLYLGIYQHNTDEYIQKYIPEIEKDLGFCFHWIKKSDWQSSLADICECFEIEDLTTMISLINLYMQENNLINLARYISDNLIEKNKIYNQDIIEIRAELGEHVLSILPKDLPKISKDYNIPIQEHPQIKLLLHSPIAVAEAINDTQHDFSIWDDSVFGETLRRNIQYSQYLNPNFYNKVILHVLQKK